MAVPETVALPGPVVAAAADDATVWLAAGGRLAAYDGGGAQRSDAPAPDGVRALAATADTLAAALEPGVVAWLDRDRGTVAAQRHVGGDPTVVAGGGAIWALDRGTERAWRLSGPGELEAPVRLPGVDDVAPDGARLWWTSRADTLLRGAEPPVDLGAGPGQRGAMTACAGSIWISVAGALLRVGAYAAELGPPLPAPDGPAAVLTCAAGILVGGSRGALFVLDPRVDDDVRRLDVELDGPLDRLVATRSSAWAIADGQGVARIVPLRPA